MHIDFGMDKFFHLDSLGVSAFSIYFYGLEQGAMLLPTERLKISLDNEC